MKGMGYTIIQDEMRKIDEIRNNDDEKQDEIQQWWWDEKQWDEKDSKFH